MDLSLIFFLVVATLSLVFSNKDDKPFLFMFVVTSVYFCILGYWYWSELRGFEFLGVYWSEELPRVRGILIYSSAAVIGLVGVIGLYAPGKKESSMVTGIFPSKYFNFFMMLGMFGALYLIVSAVQYGGYNPDDPFALLLGQFADLIIPCIIFSVGCYGLNRRNLLLILAFVIFAIFVGYRTRIILLVLPVLYVSWAKSGSAESITQRRVVISVMVILCALLFSVMTFSRQKFNSLDIDSIFGANHLDLLDGFFGETNILFGLKGVVSEYLDRDIFIGLQPLFDSVVELIPRFLYPEKQTGDYLVTSIQGLLASNAVESGTAYPFVGEYLIMGGYVGLTIGVAIFSCLVVYLRIFMQNFALAPDLRNAGMAMIATFFGYYYYSRGFLPQMFKMYIFTFLPYQILLVKSKLKSIN